MRPKNSLRILPIVVAALIALAGALYFAMGVQEPTGIEESPDLPLVITASPSTRPASLAVLAASPLATPDSPLPVPVAPLALPVDPLATPAPISPTAARAMQYLAEHEGIPLEQIIVLAESPMQFPALGREYQHVTLEAEQNDVRRQFVLLVDPKTGEVEPSLPQLRAAEEAAHRAQYGALDPLLYNRLQAAEEGDLFVVAISPAANEHTRQPEQLFAEVAALFPEAEAALQSHGAPWLVDDPALAAQIGLEYQARLEASVALSTEPILTWLESQGVAAESAPSIPIVSATLTKAQLLEASRLPAIGRIFADDNVEGPASTSP